MTTAAGGSQITDAVVFGILILVLLIKPAGLLGKMSEKSVRRRHHETEKWLSNVIILILVLALYVILSVLIQANIINPYYSGILTMVCINVILAVSLNLATGFLGQLVLGHAGFMSVGRMQPRCSPCILDCRRWQAFRWRC